MRESVSTSFVKLNFLAHAGEHAYCITFGTHENILCCLMVSLDHTVHIYLEYHSVFPLVRIGAPYPLSRKRVCLSHPRNQRMGGHSPVGEGMGGPNSDDSRKSLGTLSTLCDAV